jgi:uncharacterized protein with PQ loop repeat
MGMVPQVWRLFKLKSAHEISLTFSLCFIIGVVFFYDVMAPFFVHDVVALNS